MAPEEAIEEGFRPVVTSPVECRQACELLRGSPYLSVVLKPLKPRPEQGSVCLRGGGVELFFFLTLFSSISISLFRRDHWFGANRFSRLCLPL